MPLENPDSAPSLLSRAKDALLGPETGATVIARFAKTAPAGPGVYRMFNAEGEVLYVGKARHLKKRVQSYARGTGHNNRIGRMIADTATMEFVTTRTEIEALLLEANLIKRLKPRYNVVLRDDKSFPFILIARDHPIPQILKHRGARNRKGDYFGPFASAGAVGRTVNTLQRAFLLRSCTDSYYETRTRPCLLFQIKRCSAPCTGEISEKDYGLLVDEALGFLRGESDEVKHRLHALMDEASARQDYERAASFRDRLTALSHIQSRQGINPHTLKEADVFAAHQDAGQTCIQVFFFRSGNNWGNRAYYPRADKALPAEEVLEAFIAQFYDDKPPPKLILLSHEIKGRRLLAEALSLKADRKITVTTPHRGEKRELVDHALVTAREALARRLAESASQAAIFARLADALDLDEPPARVEVYDNSHISGTNPVGAMIVAGPEGFIKAQYRKFNMKGEDLAAGDDYAMMREMLTRRFSRLVKAKDKDPANDTGWTAPDLVLIDGGPGQLSAAHDVLDELGLSELKIAAVAKGPDRNAGRERIYLKGKEPLLLEPRDPVLYCIQTLRDEAHRFAIGAHRARRKKTLTASPLDEVAGIGPSRKRALLQHFGSAKAVSRAGIADLEGVGGISAQMAKAIYDHFHERG
ncbi:excinuclease ABC subunit C [Methyloceanibacter superfactus]|uniref:UvrABC system protein C n=1 Tax=Methyloceanibacter superfactus TaxID=1774969 RepID=A0A1E3W1G5_9HYPH|nr:excinuclease ABC subunit UvrC [Methyloceanibacter superfactus]ODR99593.1 excinuclease ABC subunit C [Methyloceanibacter superfactus]